MAQRLKNPPANSGDARDTVSIPGLGRSPGGGHATHSSIVAWEIPCTGETSGLQLMESQSLTQLSTHT